MLKGYFRVSRLHYITLHTVHSYDVENDDNDDDNYDDEYITDEILPTSGSYSLMNRLVRNLTAIAKPKSKTKRS